MAVGKEIELIEIKRNLRNRNGFSEKESRIREQKIQFGERTGFQVTENGIGRKRRELREKKKVKKGTTREENTLNESKGNRINKQ